MDGGGMGQWSNGAMEQWSNEAVEQWSCKRRVQLGECLVAETAGTRQRESEFVGRGYASQRRGQCMALWGHGRAVPSEAQVVDVVQAPKAAAAASAALFACTLHSALCTLHMLWPDLLALPLLCVLSCVSSVPSVPSVSSVPPVARHVPSTSTAVWPTCHRSPHDPPCPRLTRQQR
jgi:hypothetical protein